MAYKWLKLLIHETLVVENVLKTEMIYLWLPRLSFHNNQYEIKPLGQLDN